MENRIERFWKIQVGVCVPNWGKRLTLVSTSIVFVCCVTPRLVLAAAIVTGGACNQQYSSMDVEWLSSFPVTRVCRDVLPARMSMFVPTTRFLCLSRPHHCAALQMYGDWCWHSFRMTRLGLMCSAFWKKSLKYFFVGLACFLPVACRCYQIT